VVGAVVVGVVVDATSVVVSGGTVVVPVASGDSELHAASTSVSTVPIIKGPT
jgi:hypothetical protein